MNRVNNFIQEASKEFKTADHLIYINQTMMGGNKILLFIAKKLYASCLNCIDALLIYEKCNRRISFVPTDFESKVSIFESDVLNNFRLDHDVIETVRELHEIVNEHEESPIEFSRGDRFVICSDGYETIKTLDISSLKNHMNVIRSFLYSVNEVANNV